jgi:23S rRNA pseudouridine1911/1915/1917 synthase
MSEVETQEVETKVETQMGAPADAPIVHTATIDAAEDGQRLDRVLAAFVNDLSRSRLKTLILAGHVAISGRTIRDPGHHVNAGDEVTLVVPLAAPAAPRPENIPLAIVYEDADIVVIDKPAGLVVHPAAGNWTGTLVNALVAHCGATLSGIGGVRRPGIVHRLDKDTTGLMVVAKNDRAHRALAAQFADHGRTGPLQRGYLAFVWGTPDRPKGLIDKPIDRHPQARERMAVRTGGREAITLWEVLENYPTAALVPTPPPWEPGRPARILAECGRDARAPKEDRAREVGSGHDLRPAGAKRSGSAPVVASLLDCRLKTGRTHQIRVHLAAIGYPLLGDATYGPGFRTKMVLLSEPAREALTALSRQALHAYLLVIEHPGSGKEMVFRSELPPELANLRFALGNG